MEKHKVIDKCVSLADNFGSEKSAFVCGYLSEARSFKFEDDDGNSVEVLIDKKSQATEIVISGHGFTSAGDNGNPAVCINSEGEIIRWHSEIKYAIPFINQKFIEMGLGV